MNQGYALRAHSPVVATLKRCLALPVLAALLSLLPVLLSGCTTMLDSALQGAVESNATPESMGISTSEYRGQTCERLAASADALRKSMPDQDAFTAKTFRWRIDAINQVRSEQGCNGAGNGTKIQASGRVAMFGFCSQTSLDNNDRKQYVSTVFPFEDWYEDAGQRTVTEFKAMLRGRYGVTKFSSGCQAEDSLVKAEALRKQTRNMFWGSQVSEIDVQWAPSPRPKSAPQAGEAAAQKSVKTVASQDNDAPTVANVAETDAQKLGLKPPRGVLVSGVAAGSPAAKAGLKALDVILEVSGQTVTDITKLQVIVARMRNGYRAPIRIWRQRAMKDLTVDKAVLERMSD